MIISFLAAAAVAASAPKHPPAKSRPAAPAARPVGKAEIQALNERFGAAAKAGDPAAIGGLYAQDAVLLPPGAARLDGRNAIQAYWTGALQQIATAQLTTGEVTPLGPDYARELGVFSLTTKGTSPQVLTGKYVVIWKRDAGTWRLWTDIWNSDK